MNNYNDGLRFQMNTVVVTNKTPQSMVNTERSKIKPVLCKLISDRIDDEESIEDGIGLLDRSESESMAEN